MSIEFDVILAVSMAFNLAAILFLGHLISFHIYLQKKKITTFEYIQLKLNRKNHKSKIFREVKHDEKDEEEPCEKNKDEVLVEIETDNNGL
jgi:hypothetical protein